MQNDFISVKVYCEVLERKEFWKAVFNRYLCMWHERFLRNFLFTILLPAHLFLFDLCFSFLQLFKNACEALAPNPGLSKCSKDFSLHIFKQENCSENQDVATSYKKKI